MIRPGMSQPVSPSSVIFDHSYTSPTNPCLRGRNWGPFCWRYAIYWGPSGFCLQFL